MHEHVSMQEPSKIKKKKKKICNFGICEIYCYHNLPQKMKCQRPDHYRWQYWSNADSDSEEPEQQLSPKTASSGGFRQPSLSSLAWTTDLYLPQYLSQDLCSLSRVLLPVCCPTSPSFPTLILLSVDYLSSLLQFAFSMRLCCWPTDHWSELLKTSKPWPTLQFNLCAPVPFLCSGPAVVEWTPQ